MLRALMRATWAWLRTEYATRAWLWTDYARWRKRHRDADREVRQGYEQPIRERDNGRD